MNYEISEDRLTLTITASDEERRAMQEEPPRDEVEALESLVANSELQWISPADTGDLTNAPILGILGEEGIKDITVFLPNFGLIETGRDERGNVHAQPILERWGFEPYQIRLMTEDLIEKGSVTLRAQW